MMINEISEQPRVLIVDTDENLLNLVRVGLRLDGLGCSVKTVSSAKEALVVLKEMHIDIILADIGEDEIGGIRFLEACKKERPFCQFITLTHSHKLELLVESLELGAIDFFHKDSLNIDELCVSIEHAIMRADRWRKEVHKVLNKDSELVVHS